MYICIYLYLKSILLGIIKDSGLKPHYVASKSHPKQYWLEHWKWISHGQMLNSTNICYVIVSCPIKLLNSVLVQHRTLTHCGWCRREQRFPPGSPACPSSCPWWRVHSLQKQKLAAGQIFTLSLSGKTFIQRCREDFRTKNTKLIISPGHIVYMGHKRISWPTLQYVLWNQT